MVQVDTFIKINLLEQIQYGIVQEESLNAAKDAQAMIAEMNKKIKVKT